MILSDPQPPGPSPNQCIYRPINQGFLTEFPELRILRICCCASGGSAKGSHHRISAAPQVKPPPIASIMTRSPGLIRPSSQRRGERERDRSRRGVAVQLNRLHHFFRRDAKFMRRGVDDPLVGLMRHEPVEVLRRQPGVGEGVDHHIGHLADREAEDLLALHAHIAGGPGGGRAAIDIKLRFMPSVGAQPRGEDAAIRDWSPRLPGPPAPSRRRRRQTARRWCGPSSPGCAKKSRRRSPGRACASRKSETCRPSPRRKRNPAQTA